MSTPGEKTLSASFSSAFTFTRSVGPVVGRFLTGLRDRRIEGIVGSDGKVIVPPTEYDPVTSQALENFVEVGQSGTVTTWAWVAEPLPKHPLDRPFAWALIKLDGADTAMLHVVDAGQESRMETGMRVTARWRDETVGFITDLLCFDPVQEEGV